MLRRMISVILVLAAIAGLVSLSGCAAPPLDPAFDEEKVHAAAHELAARINAREYAAACDTFSDVLLAAVPEDKLASAFDPVLDRLGPFEQVKKTVIYGHTDKATGEAYAASILIMQYANGSAQLTLYYDLSYTLTGIYIK